MKAADPQSAPSVVQAVAAARRFPAGELQTALAVPLGEDHALHTVGPFAVVAHLLPFESEPGALPPDFDVRPHPHIGLGAVTYLFEGHLTHRDSLGSRAELGAEGVNFMIAGRGVVHSERFDRLRPLGGRLHMLQILLALPDGAEELSPSFVHVEPGRVPETVDGGAVVRWLLGAPHGTEPRVAFPSPAFLHDVRLAPGARYSPPDDFPERAVYVVSGAIDAGGQEIEPHHTVLLEPGAASSVRGIEPTRLVAFGGEPVGPRYMWWNFIHSSLDALEAAKADWRASAMPLPPGDTESFTPAPPDDGRPLQRLNAR